jgi:hypothetical protein
MRIFTLGLALVVTLPHPGFGACSGGACSVPGGGSLATDCIVELDGVMLNNPPTRPRGVVCTDGDLSCDTDATPNGACNFKINACLNNPDPRFPSCVTPSVATIEVKNRPPTSVSYNPQLASLQSAMQALVPTSANVCTAVQTITVALRDRGGVYRPNSVKIRTIATSSAGVRDRDRLKLKCLPSTVATGPGATFSRDFSV